MRSRVHMCTKSPLSILNIDNEIIHILSSDEEKIWILFEIFVIIVPLNKSRNITISHTERHTTSVYP